MCSKSKLSELRMLFNVYIGIFFKNHSRKQKQLIKPMKSFYDVKVADSYLQAETSLYLCLDRLSLVKSTVLHFSGAPLTLARFCNCTQQ